MAGLRKEPLEPGRQGMNPDSGKIMSHANLNYLGLGVVPTAAKGTASGKRVLPVAPQEVFSDLCASGEATAL